MKNGVQTHASYTSLDGMQFQQLKATDSFAQVRFNHTATNPHCQLFNASYGGAIRYNVMVRFYRSGVVDVIGSRRKAPAHEGWARFNTASGGEKWVSVFKLNHVSFNCLLVGLCLPQNIKSSVSY
ncbi:hypothetical protein ACIPVK_16545 [Paeniglutamicibacter sp. MACA_103]|uniref:hypothetical protein n=1 Tax=Paeniglutamicibacter sp. MACA_103 TaxID=3377337 RepID=UPI003894046D